MEQIVIYFFVNGTEIIKSKTKDSEIVVYPMGLGNISKDFSVDNMKNTELNGYVYDFSVDYTAIAVAVMKKNVIVQNVWIYKAYICFSRHNKY